MYQHLGNTNIELYDIFVILGAILVMIWHLSHINEQKQICGKISTSLTNYVKTKKCKIPIENITAFFELLIILTFQYLLAGIYNVWFGKLLGMGPNYMGTALIGPFMLAGVCLIIGTDLVKVYDLIAPSYPLGLIAAKLGCFCAGCCNGVAWKYGLYNHATGLTEFPVQLVEIAEAVLMFIFLVLIRKKAKPGTLYPTYLILYSSLRFVSEFTRDEPDIVGNLKLYHLCCLVGIAFGIVFLIIALLFADRISTIYTRNYHIASRFVNIIVNIKFNYHKIIKHVKKEKKKKQIIHHKKKNKKRKK